MPSFSQRKGLKPLQKTLQVEDLDEELRNRLWSVLYTYIFCNYERSDRIVGRSQKAEEAVNIAYYFWTEFCKKPADTFTEPNPNLSNTSFHFIKAGILAKPWNEALDLVEFILRDMPPSYHNELVDALNTVFEDENASFRVIGIEITEITDPIEIETIETAIQHTRGATHTHLAKALELLSDRKNKDFRNSIKESISAVEAGCQHVAKKSGATLGDAMKEIKKARQIHPAFERALISLYGYTSDSGGIRHALTEESAHPTFADAKLLMVTSAAFVNYLLTVSAEDSFPVE